MLGSPSDWSHDPILASDWPMTPRGGGDAPCTKLLSQVSSTGSRLITASCAGTRGHNEQRAEWRPDRESRVTEEAI